MLQFITMFLSWKENSKKGLRYEETIYSQSQELSCDPEQTEFRRGKGSTEISHDEGQNEREPNTVSYWRRLCWLSALTTPRNQPPSSSSSNLDWNSCFQEESFSVWQLFPEIWIMWRWNFPFLILSPQMPLLAVWHVQILNRKNNAITSHWGHQNKKFSEKLRYPFLYKTSIRKKMHTYEVWSWIFEVCTPGKYFVDSLQRSSTNLK